jgi:hypothetical protein
MSGHFSEHSGGPAFPVHSDAGKEYNYLLHGMSLRDWFAGMALKALLSDDEAGTIESTARDAYRYADAMLEERKK